MTHLSERHTLSRFSRLSADLVGHAWARRVDQRSSEGLAGSSSRTLGHRNPRSQRFGEPLLLPGFRPPYVRNVRREVAHCECCDTMSHVVSVLVKEVWLMPEA